MSEQHVHPSMKFQPTSKLLDRKTMNQYIQVETEDELSVLSPIRKAFRPFRSECTYNVRISQQSWHAKDRLSQCLKGKCLNLWNLRLRWLSIKLHKEGPEAWNWATINPFLSRPPPSPIIENNRIINADLDSGGFDNFVYTLSVATLIGAPHLYPTYS